MSGFSKRQRFIRQLLSAISLEVLSALNDEAGPNGVLELPYLWEFFTVFDNADGFLRGRKTFLA